MKDNGHSYIFVEKTKLDIKSCVSARLDLIRLDLSD